MYLKTLTTALSFTILTACGTDDLGVLSIQFDLASAAPEILPEELAELDPESLHEAAGTIDCDVVEGVIAIDAHDLPDPPEGWSWIPILTFADSVRDGLPGSGLKEAGHAHGARATGDSDAEEGHMVMLDPLLLVGESEWSGLATKSTIEPPLGALRSAMIMLAPDGESPMEAPATMVLAGELSFEEADEAGATAEEEAGHAHGV
jgi:hypothetical protein